MLTRKKKIVIGSVVGLTLLGGLASIGDDEEVRGTARPAASAPAEPQEAPEPPAPVEEPEPEVVEEEPAPEPEPVEEAPAPEPEEEVAPEDRRHLPPALEPGEEPAPDPTDEEVVTSDEIPAEILDSLVVEQLRDRGIIPLYGSPSDAISLGHITCDALDAGVSQEELWAQMLSSGFTAADAGFTYGTVVAAYCPEHS